MWFSFPKCNNESTKGATKLKEQKKNKKWTIFFKLIIKVHAFKNIKELK